MEVQQNTMTGEGKSSDNDTTHNKKPLSTFYSTKCQCPNSSTYDIVRESYKILEALEIGATGIFPQQVISSLHCTRRENLSAIQVNGDYFILNWAIKLSRILCR